MAKNDTKRTLMAVLAPEDEETVSRRAGAPPLPSLDSRVELYLRAMHGARAASAQERAEARLRIIDAMADKLADDLAGTSGVAPILNKGAAPARTAARPTASGSNILAQAWDVLREALLWPLTLSGGQPLRLVAVSCAVLLVAGGAWTATWFYAARTTETAIATWIDQEAKAGRDYSCGSRSVGGFPLHVEVQCTALQARLAMSEQSTVVVNARSLHAIASILSPGTLVADISGPVSLSGSTQAANFFGNWSLARLTLRGQPANPSRVSLVLDNPEFYRVAQGADKPLVAGGRFELSASVIGPSLINIVVHATAVSIAEGGPIASRPFVADLSAALHGVAEQAPQMLSARIRDWQSHGGYLDVAQARMQQGDSFAIGGGQLRLNANGRVDGTLHVNAGGLYERLAQSVIRDGQTGAQERERLAQSVLGEPRVRVRSLGLPNSEPMQPKQPPPGAGNIDIPIRIVDGTVLIGASGIGEIPPLFSVP